MGMEACELIPLLTVPEVAKWLAKHPGQVRRMAREGKLPGAIKIEETWRFDRRAIEDWLRQEAQANGVQKC